MQTVVIVVHLMIVLALIGFVLLQRSEGGGLGTGSTGGNFLSSRGTANVLTRTTAFLAIAFFATSLLLSALAGMDRAPRSIFQGGSTPNSQPGAPGTPLAPSGGGLLDQLGGQSQQQPSGPQVPQSR